MNGYLTVETKNQIFLRQKHTKSREYTCLHEKLDYFTVEKCKKQGKYIFSENIRIFYGRNMQKEKKNTCLQELLVNITVKHAKSRENTCLREILTTTNVSSHQSTYFLNFLMQSARKLNTTKKRFPKFMRFFKCLKLLLEYSPQIIFCWANFS